MTCLFPSCRRKSGTSSDFTGAADTVPTGTAPNGAARRLRGSKTDGPGRTTRRVVLVCDESQQLPEGGHETASDVRRDVVGTRSRSRSS